jgi:DNA topoisomerase-1
MDDMVKFDKARKLDKNIAKIRKKYTRDLSSPKADVKQLATAVYLLDMLAIRPGTDKDETKEAGTLGLTTLKCGNISFKSGHTVTINFTGKSSIKFIRTVVINAKAYANMKKLCGSSRTKSLFPLVKASTLNAYLKTLLPGLTAKVFRTWTASSVFQRELDKNIPDAQEETYEKKMAYNNVNIEVAKALNHKRMADNEEKVRKLEAKLAELALKKKAAKTAASKARVQKSITLNRGKLEEAKHNISTSTSKVNYIDPRITVAWAKKAEMPIEKLYNKTQLQKFVWAMETQQNWRF